MSFESLLAVSREESRGGFIDLRAHALQDAGIALLQSKGKIVPTLQGVCVGESTDVKRTYQKGGYLNLGSKIGTLGTLVQNLIQGRESIPEEQKDNLLYDAGCVAWHPQRPRLAVKDLNNRVAIYSIDLNIHATENRIAMAQNSYQSESKTALNLDDNEQDVLCLLQDIDQTGIVNLSWRPYSGACLAVGCDNATVVVWSTKMAKVER